MKPQSLLHGVVDREPDQNGFDGRRLIVVSVEGAEGPTQARNGDGGAETRADGGLGDGRRSEVAAKLPSENRVGRIPAESVSQEKGLNLSSM